MQDAGESRSPRNWAAGSGGIPELADLVLAWVFSPANPVLSALQTDCSPRGP